MIKPAHYVTSPGNFFIDLTQVAVAVKSEDGRLILYLKNLTQPVLIDCDEVQTKAIIAYTAEYNHYVANL